MSVPVFIPGIPGIPLLATKVSPVTNPTSATPGTSQPTDPNSKANSNNTGLVIGTFFGGLGAGLAICAAVLLILLFRHRRASKNGPTNLLAGDAEKKSLLAERQSLLAQLSEAQAERTQLRTHLQVSDTQDPRDVVEAFDRLNVSIRKACLLASRSLLKSAQSKALRTTKDASNLNQLQRDLVGVPTLVLSEKGAGRKLEDFLSEALRFIVNAALVSKLFDTFHPDISPEENKLLLEMYRGIRRSDPQLLAARWRCLAYSAIDNIKQSPSHWPAQFTDACLRSLSSIVTSLFGEKAPGFSANFASELSTIAADAYNWNRSVKCTFKSLDFAPVLFTGADRFDTASMTLYMNHKADQVPPRTIIVGVTLGLFSLVAVASGQGIKDEYVWQTKSEVLTEGFFK